MWVENKVSVMHKSVTSFAGVKFDLTFLFLGESLQHSFEGTNYVSDVYQFRVLKEKTSLNCCRWMKFNLGDNC